MIARIGLALWILLLPIAGMADSWINSKISDIQQWLDRTTAPQSHCPTLHTHIPIFTVSNLGLIIRDGRLAIEPTHNRCNVIGNGLIGNHAFKLDGYWSLTHRQVQFTLSGQDLAAINTPGLSLITSPQLQLTWQKQHLALSGQVDIPKGNIDLMAIQKQWQKNPDIQVIAPPSHTITIQTNTHWHIGPDVQVTGFGIQAKLTGNIDVQGSVEQSLSARGSLKLVDASYHLFGRILSVTAGSLTFTDDPIDNPHLNITAATSINDTSLTLTITGTLQQPRWKISGQPETSTSNALALLSTGKPLHDLPPTRQQLIITAAKQFFRQGDQPIAAQGFNSNLISMGTIGEPQLRNIASNPNSSINTTDGDDSPAAVFIGQAITPQVYVSYGIGIYNQQQEIRSRIRLTEYLDLLTDHSTDYSGADLVLRINRD